VSASPPSNALLNTVKRLTSGNAPDPHELTEAFEALRASNCVDTDNPSGAVGLYEGLGFRIVARMEAVARPFP